MKKAYRWALGILGSLVCYGEETTEAFEALEYCRLSIFDTLSLESPDKFNNPTHVTILPQPESIIPRCVLAKKFLLHIVNEKYLFSRFIRILKSREGGDLAEVKEIKQPIFPSLLGRRQVLRLEAFSISMWLSIA
jgi:hypothetical protein